MASQKRTFTHDNRSIEIREYDDGQETKVRAYLGDRIVHEGSVKNEYIIDARINNLPDPLEQVRLTVQSDIEEEIVTIH